VPSPCRLVSRELLYTALTRQRQRIVVLHQGGIAELQRYSQVGRSETARRFTNLFDAPHPVEVEGQFLEDRLIHRTARGEAVRSKSEVIIADHLAHRNIRYKYEKALTMGEITKYPDFTIEDDDAGITYFWEHCGMLADPQYREKWKAKEHWYRQNGILPFAEGGGPNGTLIVTQDEPNGGISSDGIAGVMLKAFSK
jgi:hypothetical protein